MFVFSVKSQRSGIAAVGALLLLVAVGAVLCIRAGSGGRSDAPGETAPVPSEIDDRHMADASGDGPLMYAAGDASERIAFIRRFGWDVREEPEEIAEIAIPESFDDVYEKYNAIQIAQGLDLSGYRGRRVKRWSYAVTNYPGMEDSADRVRIDLLVCDAKVIGGSVYSLDVNGFMHGFAAPSD